jgi:glyoxylase-like metal-dependent hydrolase (beta-lactamase superfamily II)
MEVAAGVHQIDGVRGGHCFLVLGDQLTLVDTGMRGSAGRVVDYIRKLNRRPRNLSLIILTHCHLDHVGSAKEIRQVLNPQVAAGEADIQYITGEEVVPRRQSGPVAQVAVGLIDRIFPYVPVQVDIPLHDDEELSAGGGMQVIHTPGHTPGSICLYMPAQKVLFAGDALVNSGGKLRVAPARFAMDPEEAEQSIKRLPGLDVETILFGHGPALKCRAAENLRGLVE